MPRFTLRPFRTFYAIGLLCAAAGCATTRSPDSELMQTRQKFSAQFSKQAELGYLLYLPPGYDAKAAKQWPLVLFLHGSGERGTNLAQVAVHGPPKLVKKNPPVPKKESDEARKDRETATRLLAEKFIVVSPQCPDDQCWDSDALLGLLDRVQAGHKVDKSRVYLTGLSMGGYGSWALLAKAPERFAAVAPICGGGSTIDFLLPARGKTAALKATPVWAFHGAKDSVVLLAESERLMALLKKLGVKDVQLTVYPEANHDSWTATYNNPKLYEWFLSHERK
ncbi:MAG: phospholipase/carboxylesterase [Limisphaerales bacterium]|nr:MAG: phospholipase/carboxylesterase [Limisphaerales bacterium]KAG0509964.1 MAG: phospholipase/carboxylesterase [Limisphaerales bacterium]TXT53146.1 MAG: phospholipase/carboxylesterase [Limisphaerales bacterium]